MALDLFVNFERESNNSIFYRSISASPFTGVAILSNLEGDSDYQTFLYENFIAKFTLNNSTPQSTFDLLTGVNLSFNRQQPTLSTIQVYLYSTNEPETLVEFYNLSARFVAEFPKASFVAYPSMVIDETINRPIPLNSSNYTKSNGVFFYGEGHTETIVLSTRTYPSGTTANWLVGNFLDELQTTSKYQLSSTFFANIQTTKLSSVKSQDTKIPINLRLSNSTFLTSGPILYYDDLTGEPKFYEHFATSLTPDNQHSTSATKFTSSIHIKPYPYISQYNFTPPFKSATVSLPNNGTNKSFTAEVTTKNLSALFFHKLSSTTWNIQTDVDSFDTASNWSYTTTPLQQITTYRFPLAYELQSTELTPIFKIPGEYNTTVQMNLSVEKEIQIKHPPYDWLPNIQHETFSAQTRVTQVPALKIYCENYYNLTFLPIKLTILDSNISENFELQNLKLITDTETINLTSQDQYKISSPFLTFNKTGTKNLTSVATYKISDETFDIVQTFYNITEVVNTIDVLSEDVSFYASDQTPIIPVLTAAPIISPNEWAIADTINYSLKSLYDCVEQIKKSLFLYQPTAFLYAWLGPEKYNWADLECDSDTTFKLKWNQNLITQGSTQDNNGFPLFWTQQQCDERVIDPSCLQKYCLQWKWKKRRKQFSKVFATWKNTKQENGLAKKWKYEPCEIDSNKIDCFKGRWHYATVDPQFFPLPFCNLSQVECKIKSVVKDQNNNFIIAHPTELNLYDDSSTPKILARRGNADEIFNFANIENISIDSDGKKIFVLDSFLPRVCVYEVTENDFVFTTSWGRYGLAGDAYGFNKPKHLHVDNKNNVWITDSGNFAIKCYSSIGKHLCTFTNEEWQNENLIGVSVDSESKLHVLTSTKVMVYSHNFLNNKEVKLFEYYLNEEVDPISISTSFNRELIYITHNSGLVKYFRTGTIFQKVIDNLLCSNGKTLNGYHHVFQDNMRNLFVSVNNKILLIPDRMKIDINYLSEFEKLNLYWDFSKIQIHKNEYIQPWVYLKAFHRLWDNIELVRGLFSFKKIKIPRSIKPTFPKEQLTIGQNEIVSNAVINRLITQLWTNIEDMQKNIV